MNDTDVSTNGPRTTIPGAIRAILAWLRSWIDASEGHLIATCIAIVEIPVVAAMWMLCGFLGAHWWVMPTVIGSAVLLISWVLLAVSALTRWLS